MLTQETEIVFKRIASHTLSLKEAKKQGEMPLCNLSLNNMYVSTGQSLHNLMVTPLHTTI